LILQKCTRIDGILEETHQLLESNVLKDESFKISFIPYYFNKNRPSAPFKIGSASPNATSSNEPIILSTKKAGPVNGTAIILKASFVPVLIFLIPSGVPKAPIRATVPKGGKHKRIPLQAVEGKSKSSITRSFTHCFAALKQITPTGRPHRAPLQAMYEFFSKVFFIPIKFVDYFFSTITVDGIFTYLKEPGKATATIPRYCIL